MYFHSICSELLNKFADWLQKKQCSNYFIPEANLFQDQPRSDILEKTVRQLNKFGNAGILCHWFVENYILFFIRRHSEPLGNMSHFVDYTLRLFEQWKKNQLQSLEFYFIGAFAYCHDGFRSIIKQGLNTGFRQGLLMQYICRRHESIEDRPPNNFELKNWMIMRDIPEIHSVSCLTHHDNILCILHTAYGLDCGEISWDGGLCVEAVNAISTKNKITRSAYHNFPRLCSAQSSRSQFLRAQDLMQNLTGSNSRTEFQLLSLMAKGFLRRTLKHNGRPTVSNGIVPAALCYLSALHFATSEYRESTRLCSALHMDNTSIEDTETLNAGCLFFINDVARIVGLYVLQKKNTENNPHYINRRLYLDLRLSSGVFARYLFGLSAERMGRQSTFYHDFPESLFPMDAHFKALTKPKCIVSIKSNSFLYATRLIAYRRPYFLIEIEASNVNPTIIKERVIDALMEYALENMTSFYNMIRKDFGVNCNTADCYRALYLYKCRKYDQVMRLCEQILKDSDLRNDLKKFAFANVLLLPPFDYFFERDVQSLLGFHTLFYYLNSLNNDLEEIE